MTEPTAREAVESLLHAVAADYSDPSHPPGCLVISAVTTCTPASEDVKHELREIREGTKKAIERRIAADVASGLLPQDTDARGLAVFYAAVVQGMSTQAVDGVGREDLERVVTAAMAAWPASQPVSPAL